MTARVAEAARAADRDPAGITTIVVTKFQPISLVEELAALGVRDFGENRHQEARDKAAARPDLRWHFVGQLQGKKARQVRAYASVIHSVDREPLVDALAGDDPVDVFLQVNLSGDAGRGGASPADVPALAERIAAAPGLALLGVMAVAPLGEEPRAAFARLRELAETVRAIEPSATAISAGMSGDLEAAVAEGTTHLRVGTAITGPRPDAP
ncbi:MAG TPA: YggS family pyridoxal phosphate-dependent enzyme [Naasia sp.]